MMEAIRRRTPFQVVAALCSAACVVGAGAGSARAAGDFPAASCKGWNATVVARSGVDTARAFMRGSITRDDLREYCERDPEGETRANGGPMTVAQCVDHHFARERETRLLAEANCRTGRITFRLGTREPRRARFPLGPGADTSCVSGMPPVIAQFRALCPTAAAALRLPD